MNKTILIVLFLAFTTSLSFGQQSKTSQNGNNHLLMATAWYQKSAEMRAIYYQTYYLAKLALETKLSKHDSRPHPAVVLDIDETVLDNSPFEVNCITTGQSYTPDFWKSWTNQASAKALPGAIDFLRFACDRGCEIFYISNRTKEELEMTIKNMSMLEFPFADEQHILLRTETSDKTERRKTVDGKFSVILLIGDNLSDFDAVFDKRGPDFGFALVDSLNWRFGTDFIILPNPMYGDWEKQFYFGVEKPDQKQKLELIKKNLTGF